MRPSFWKCGWCCTCAAWALCRFVTILGSSLLPAAEAACTEQQECVSSISAMLLSRCHHTKTDPEQMHHAPVSTPRPQLLLACHWLAEQLHMWSLHMALVPL